VHVWAGCYLSSSFPDMDVTFRSKAIHVPMGKWGVWLLGAMRSHRRLKKTVIHEARAHDFIHEDTVLAFVIWHVLPWSPENTHSRRAKEYLVREEEEELACRARSRDQKICVCFFHRFGALFLRVSRRWPWRFRALDLFVIYKESSSKSYPV
jgi:hypothetical protein